MSLWFIGKLGGIDEVATLLFLTTALSATLATILNFTKANPDV